MGIILTPFVQTGRARGGLCMQCQSELMIASAAQSVHHNRLNTPSAAGERENARPTKVALKLFVTVLQLSKLYFLLCFWVHFAVALFHSTRLNVLFPFNMHFCHCVLHWVALECCSSFHFLLLL